MAVASSASNTSKLQKKATEEWQVDLTSFRVIVAPSVLLMAAILFGNFLVIASYKTNRRLRTRTNAFLVSLAISDFLVGSVSLPMWIYMITMEWKVSAAFQAVFKSFDVFAALASIFHLTAISVERYIAVSRPFYYKSLSSFFHRVLIASAWFNAAFLASLSPLSTALKNNWGVRLYSVVMFICGFAVPTAVIACMYAGVFSVARSLLQRFPSRPASQQSAGILRQYYQGERRVAITVALITCLFIAAWVPFFGVSVTAAFCLKCLPTQGSLYALIIIVKSMHYMNSAVNPLVYARRDRAMRRTFLRLLGVRWGICRFDVEEETPWGFPMQAL